MDRSGLRGLHPAAAQHGKQDTIAHPGRSELEQPPGVEAERRVVNFDQRDEHVVAQPGVRELDDVSHRHGFGAYGSQQQ